MAFSGERQPFEGAGADAVPDQNVLLARMRGGTAESYVTHLAGLRATPIQQRGTVEHMLRQVTAPCHNASLSLASGPLFSELFCRCTFHLPTRPTSPFDLSCRQTLIGE